MLSNSISGNMIQNVQPTYLQAGKQGSGTTHNKILLPPARHPKESARTLESVN